MTTDSISTILPTLITYGGLTSLFVTATIFTLTIVRSNSKTEEEQGLTPIYSERCGGRFGLANWTIPFVRLIFYQEFLVISWWHKLTIEYKQIARIENAGLLTSGIEIITATPTKYRKLIIWTRNRELVLDLLKEKIKDTDRLSG